MNLNITRKFLKNYNVVSTGYCNLQYLLRHEERIGRNAGVYGWNYDCYRFNNFMLVTGYRCNVSSIDINHKIVNRYENLARKLADKCNKDWKKYSYDVEKKLFDRLVNRFEREINNKYFKKGA